MCKTCLVFYIIGSLEILALAGWGADSVQDPSVFYKIGSLSNINPARAALA